MERLKIMLMVAAIAAITAPALAQQSSRVSSLSAAATPSLFTVIGDVQEPRTGPLPPSGRVTVLEAVRQAGLLSPRCTVSILRDNQERALWTQIIAADSTDGGEQVSPGDVLVVQAMDSQIQNSPANAAIRTDAGVLVVLLQDDAVAIGDILQQTVGLPSPDQQLQISCRFQGRQPAGKPTLATVVSHGDVVSIARTNRKTLRGFGSMAPAFSEWKSDTNDVTVIQPALNSTTSEGDSSSDVAVEFPFDFSQGLAEPAEPSVDMPMAAEEEVLAGEDHEDALPVTAIVQTTELPLETAPLPPTNQPVGFGAPETVQSGMNVWNMMLIGGLILAAILLLAGSLGADEGNDVIQRQSTSQSSAQSVSQGVSNAASVAVGSALPLSISQPRAMTATNSAGQVASGRTTFAQNIAGQANTAPANAGQSSFTPGEEANVAANADATKTVISAFAVDARVSLMKIQAGMNDAESNLVQAGEWFGKDWRATDGRRNEAMVPVGSIPAAASIAPTPVADTMPGASVKEILQEAIPRIPAPVLSTPLNEQTTQEVESLIRSITAEVHKAEPVVAPASASASAVSGGEFLDLEDLLQNRLPIDLCEAQLPLRINLFGRPAGPRRLRIDSAHQVLSGPHTHLSAERRQTETGIGATAGSELAAMALEKLQPALDDALNSLQDRTNS